MEEKQEKKEKSVEEDVNITVKEQAGRKVHDMNFSMNTGQNMIMERVTPTITGELDAIIINAEAPVSILIELDELKDVVLFKEGSFGGTKFLPLITQPVDNMNKVLINEYTKWVLNNKLRIVVKGRKDITVNFTVRWR